MYAARFTVFYVIAALAAFASASPVPVHAPEAREIDVAVVAREPLPSTPEDLAARGGCNMSGAGREDCL